MARSSRLADLLSAALLLCGASLGGCKHEPGEGGGGGRKGQPLHVAAAADLAVAFAEIGTAFEASSGKKVDFSFGSTGLLAKQIAEGAPFDVFAAANVSYVDDVVKSEACLGDSKRTYARGRIVLWAKDREHLPADLGALRDSRYQKIAIANPEHAPYGLAAREALTKTGVWDSVETRLVLGTNVQQTLMFAQSGNAEVSIVALSLAVTAGGAYVPIDESLHAPLEQALVVCKGGPAGGKPNEARLFVDYVGSEAGRTIMRKYGFLLPGDPLPAK